MKKAVLLALYYMLGKHLPNSYYPLGGLFNGLRISLLKGILVIGRDCKVQSNVDVGDGNAIEIGNHCQINQNVKLDNVKIANFVMIAPGVTILGKMHSYDRRDIPMILQGEQSVRPTIIEEDVWIGTNAILMPGVIVRKGCIVAAGTVVTKDCDAFGIYAGVPARRVGQR